MYFLVLCDGTPRGLYTSGCDAWERARSLRDAAVVRMTPNSDYDRYREETEPPSGGDESGGESDDEVGRFDPDPPEPKRVEWWMTNYGQ